MPVTPVELEVRYARRTQILGDGPSPASGCALGRNQRSADGCLSFDRRCSV
jgi:hypothetical protein